MIHRYRRLVAALVVLAAVAIGTGLAFYVEGLRWRVAVVAMKASGRIEGIGWADLLSMLQPGSRVYVKGLLHTPNAYAVILNPYAFASDRGSGELLFATRCASCHGETGAGQTAPSLVGRTLKFGDADWSLFQTVTEGRPELGMPPAGVSDDEAWQIVEHVRSLRNGWSALAESQTGAKHAPKIDVDAERIERAASEPQNWLTYSGNYSSWRYSRLEEITTANVTSLTLAWSLQIETQEQYIEATPIVVDGAMYVTSPLGDVVAADASTGEVFWRYASGTRSDVPTCCGPNNRGVAVLGSRVFVGTLDNRVVALDAATGAVAWEIQVANPVDGFSMTGAPLAIGDKIVVGIAGSEFGIRGFLDAYDAATGERAWRFYTIPAPGEPGSETWENDAWVTGGGSTWVTGSFDPALGLVYWGVGNPAPDFNRDVRPGDNLYTASVVALDVDTGELKWHFQFTPHDEHDWDSNQVPVLVDREIDGELRHLMLWGNRNGFYYVLDRVTGKFIHATPLVKQTWAERIDESGRPVLLPSSSPSSLGTLTWPGLSGGGNWWSPSYNPGTNLVYIPFAEGPKVFFKNANFEDAEPIPGQQFLGSASMATGEPLQAGIRALDPLTGAVKWEYLRLRPQRNVGWIGGVLTTAGNLAFFGDLHDFRAFDAAQGRELWRVNLGGHINAAPISYAIDGRQHIAIMAGNALFVFRL
jgi:alcohol dehydrogenase (cytochrome c)